MAPWTFYVLCFTFFIHSLTCLPLPPFFWLARNRLLSGQLQLDDIHVRLEHSIDKVRLAPLV